MAYLDESLAPGESIVARFELFAKQLRNGRIDDLNRGERVKQVLSEGEAIVTSILDIGGAELDNQVRDLSLR